MSNYDTFLKSARRTLNIEISALQALEQRLDKSFAEACTLIHQCTGKVIVCGVGKSGHIAAKIAATMASTGTAAFSLHPTEAAHGDIGMVQHNDLVIAISYSGSSDELMVLLPALRHKRVDIIAITGNPNSPLVQAAKTHINTLVIEEACPHNLAPTASTTAAMVIGDMLAIALLETRGFTKKEFALLHPAGRLGKRLVVQIGDIMHKAPNIPLISADVSLEKSLIVMTQHKLGMLGVINEKQHLIGLFTDGDLRRTIENTRTWQDVPIAKLMTTRFTTFKQHTLAAEALQRFEDKKINGAFVIDDNGKPLGAFNMHDLLQSGIL